VLRDKAVDFPDRLFSPSQFNLLVLGLKIQNYNQGVTGTTIWEALTTTSRPSSSPDHNT
jgi:hypothetical protein